MIHDPLCPVTNCRPTADECYCDNGSHFCHCKTIAKVRVDEQTRQREEMTALLLEAIVVPSRPNVIHDPLCNIVDGSCCPWMGDCTCQCNCNFIAEVRRDDRQRVQEGEILEEYMCPFCVTPWKCNGPHIDQDDLENFEHYVQYKIKEALDGIYSTEGI